MIIKSILDNDLYKFTMQNAVMNVYPYAEVEYKFINRGNHVFTDQMINDICYHIKVMESLHLSREEYEWICNIFDKFNPVYLDYLRNYRFDSNEIEITTNNGFELTIRGPWFRTILWEVPLMAIISEVYMYYTYPKINVPNAIPNYFMGEDDFNKFEKFTKLKENNIDFYDFGTRRRFSFYNHDMVVARAKEYSGDNFCGTSNLYFAKKYDIDPIGSIAHEWYMYHGAVNRYRNANVHAVLAWKKQYPSRNATMLTDTYTSDVFFRDHYFDTYNYRQDSGCPFEFVDKLVEFCKQDCYERLSEKHIIFSDSLTVDKAIEIKKYCEGKVDCSFGIGTNLTNDIEGVKPLNVVIKMNSCRPNKNEKFIPTIKLSDSKGKHSGDLEEIKKCKMELGIK